MQFLLLIYKDQAQFAQIPDAEKKRVSDACDTWYEKLQGTGHAIAMQRLHATTTAATVRQSGKRLGVTDGPFAETKEVLGGFVLLACRDRAAAIDLAKTFPGIALGVTVEVRPVAAPEDAEHC